ncbi:HlyD family efflux transporter periplasmic adaptor subunit [Marivirga arenosa]|uniref:HlyD family efflux transporter periplasmic adaptor subunit n=1 Tax=Marivirga arenosa TaxID=3059076 RepID=A0AA51ZXG9_9BACT|nr:HlyD family efflux transporter periplasmic adaptor subunit [Marivirga sp. BKB1-2]WNB18526.1 HlyD family efflux transporter periplasmic adaptor subunit [Marivirga sp. BKB1-2]
MPIDNSLNSEQQSHEMEEIVGKVPNWITRWGITVLFFVALIGAFISAFIQFPDTISADVIIQALEQPGKVSLTRDDASQEFIFMVKDEDFVKPGDTLFIHKNDKLKINKPIITPMSGQVFITKGIDADNTQDYLVWVVPKTTDFEVKLKYPLKGSGKIENGQEVVINIQNYPPSDFGYLTGKISKILPVPLEGQMQAYVKLDSMKLKTNTGKILPLDYLMEGKAEIILENRTIAKRIFGNILP